ncbi:MAG TPA: hypothetical protein VKU37_09740 [Verrucomicrobiae bacterium]|nr:hypothetical protein [Verrucomicrobiae bacterium]
MTGVGTPLDSLRFSRLESRRLAWVFAVSLLAHLLAWGGYEAGKEFNLWQRLHLPPLMLFTKIKPTPASVPESVPIEFVDVNPAQATPEAPKNAKYYSNQNSRAANPDAKRDANTPQLNGTQTEVVKTEDVPRPDFSKLQPTMQPSREQLAEARPQNAGDLTLGNPSDTPSAEPPRPRTLKQALAQQNRLPGVKMKQDGGVRREALVPALDVKATPFGAYDAAFIQAVTQRWYDLLDSRQFARDRSGKVVLRFHLNYDGRISDMEVVQNTVGDLLGYVCQKAVMDPAPYAEWPTDMRAMVGLDYREITFTFYYY